MDIKHTPAHRRIGLLFAFVLANVQVACVVPNGPLSGEQPQHSNTRRSSTKGLFGLSDNVSAPADTNTLPPLSNAVSPPMSHFGGATNRSQTVDGRKPDRGSDRGTITQRSLQDSGELVKVEGNTWRTALPATRVFSLLGRSLSQNYILSRVDRRNLSLQTDWDKFFIDGRLFRNRFVVSVFPVGPRQTEVLIRNTLEYFSGAAGQPGSQTDGDWLPSPDITDEVAKLVDNVNLQIQNAALSRTRR